MSPSSVDVLVFCSLCLLSSAKKLSFCMLLNSAMLCARSFLKVLSASFISVLDAVALLLLLSLKADNFLSIVSVR